MCPEVKWYPDFYHKSMGPLNGDDLTSTKTPNGQSAIDNWVNSTPITDEQVAIICGHQNTCTLTAPPRFAQKPKSAIKWIKREQKHTLILLPSANWYQDGTSRCIDVVSHIDVCVPRENAVRILHLITQAMEGSSTKKKRRKKLVKQKNVYNMVFIYCLASFRFCCRQFAHRECEQWTPHSVSVHVAWLPRTHRGWRDGAVPALMFVEATFFISKYHLLLIVLILGRACEVFAPNATSLAVRSIISCRFASTVRLGIRFFIPLGSQMIIAPTRLCSLLSEQIRQSTINQPTHWIDLLVNSEVSW